MVHVETSSGQWEAFCRRVTNFLHADCIALQVDGEAVRGFRSPDSPALWIRDHSDILRAGKYVEADVRSAVDVFAKHQAANGRIFDYVTTEAGTEPENWEKWVRVPVEADVEYRFVKAAYLAWQASGDDTWVGERLPQLERALSYTLTHPLRWDRGHGLPKRPYTIDTWDFDYTAGRVPWLNFQISDGTFWGIMHGDVSGVYEAAGMLARLYERFGRGADAARWRAVATSVQERANALLFNGRFYTHFHKLTPVTIDGLDEAEQLSLSNPMDINRGLATHEMAVAILREYRRRRESTAAFAEWFSIDPPFPDGLFGEEKIVAGAYCNGGIMPLVGGELARAAFEHGFEGYGFEILQQYREMIAESGETYLWYFPDGTASSVATSTSPEAMPTDGWGSSAMLYAFVEGLCGIEDKAHSFREVRCSPRWAATPETEVVVEARYAASGCGFRYRYTHTPGEGLITLHIDAHEADVELHLLIPPNSRVVEAVWDGEVAPVATVRVEESSYVDLLRRVRGGASVEVRYALS